MEMMVPIRGENGEVIEVSWNEVDWESLDLTDDFYQDLCVDNGGFFWCNDVQHSKNESDIL